MRRWLLLAAAILSEVAGTLALRGFQDHRAWLAVLVPCFIASFVFLSRVLRAGMPVGVAYGIWGASGTALTAVLAAVLFDEPFTTPAVVGIGLIIAGVLLVEFGSPRDESGSAQAAEPAR